jgi:O-acetylhomoserine (thiol)-lyase
MNQKETSMKDETKCLHAGYTPKNSEPRVVPIVQSTTYVYDSTEQIGELFNMPAGMIYSRFTNPTNDAVEQKINALEGGIGAMLTSSGQSALLLAILNLCSAGDSIVCSHAVYGGTINLLSFTLQRYGVECIFIDPDADEGEISRAIKPNSKALLGETIANPTLHVLDIEKFARVAHANNIPLIVDNTFATPVLCKPFEYGADIIVHSTSKYMDGHALQVGGAVVDSGNFDWQNSGKFPAFTEPDTSYHGIIYTRDFGKAAYIAKIRTQLMRDLGVYPSAHSAFLLNIGLETLPLRMERYCQNALAVAEFFSQSDKVESVRYPMLKGDSQNERIKKYCPKGASGVVSVSMRGSRENAAAFINRLKLASKEVHVADIRTCVLHPATSTHRQLTDEQLKAAGVHPGLVRFSVGLEHIDDILADIAQAL